MLQSTFARVARFATSVLRVRALDKLAADDARRVRWGWVVALAVLGVLLASGSARAQGHGGGCHVAPGCTPTGNPCTVAVCVDDDLGGSHCMTHPVTGVSCDDGVFCNGTDTCDSTGSCSVHKGDPCPGADGDGNCAESCNEAGNSCTGPDPAGSACDDGNVCDGTAPAIA